jgi:hypothetical protein
VAPTLTLGIRKRRIEGKFMSVHDMSEHDRGDTRGSGAAPATQPFAVSRRTLVKTAAGAGVAAAAVGFVGVAHAAGGPAASDATAAGAPLALSEANATAANGPVVVHVTDFARGTIEIFTNGVRTQTTDVDLVNRIARATNSSAR